MSLPLFSLVGFGCITHRASKLSLTLLVIGLLQACASGTQSSSLSYDFGTVAKENNAAPSKIAISLADVSAPATLDSNAMLYRLAYDNAQLLHPYANHHWSMPPAQLFTQRFKSRIAATGGTVLGATDGVAELPVLRIEMDEFSQVFTSTTQSEAKIALRVTLIKKNKLIAQQYFDLATASASADASGGAKAMQVTADRSISAILAWLQTQQIN
ncbi:MAG: ABC-type transport auxiliary lipoprotein family protein [Pseudomonadota bacterium]